MLETKLIQGADLAAVDQKILAIAEKHAFNPWPGVPLDAIVCNEAGDAYRTIRMHTKIGFKRFVDDVQAELGLIDRVGYSATLNCLSDDFTGERLRIPVEAFLQFDRVARPLPALPLKFVD